MAEPATGGMSPEYECQTIVNPFLTRDTRTRTGRASACLGLVRGCDQPVAFGRDSGGWHKRRKRDARLPKQRARFIAGERFADGDRLSLLSTPLA